jgi:hypothetical protein
MRSRDVINLFAEISVGTRIAILNVHLRDAIEQMSTAASLLASSSD